VAVKISQILTFFRPPTIQKVAKLFILFFIMYSTKLFILTFVRSGHMYPAIQADVAVHRTGDGQIFKTFSATTA
jgi:hypothetical protein